MRSPPLGLRQHQRRGAALQMQVQQGDMATRSVESCNARLTAIVVVPTPPRAPQTATTLPPRAAAGWPGITAICGSEQSRDPFTRHRFVDVFGDSRYRGPGRDRIPDIATLRR